MTLFHEFLWGMLCLKQAPGDSWAGLSTPHNILDLLAYEDMKKHLDTGMILKIIQDARIYPAYFLHRPLKFCRQLLYGIHMYFPLHITTGKAKRHHRFNPVLSFIKHCV